MSETKMPPKMDGEAWRGMPHEERAAGGEP